MLAFFLSNAGIIICDNCPMVSAFVPEDLLVKVANGAKPSRTIQHRDFIIGGIDMKRYLLLSCLLLMSACSGLPERVRNVPVSDVSYVQATQNLNSYKGTSVRWGGVIVDVENEEKFTVVQVLSYPQNSYGRPQLRNQSGGRFVIKSSEFLDPAVYAKDKEITVAGTIEGDIERTIGKKTIRMPLVSSIAVYLWPAYQSYPYYEYGYGGYRGFGGFNPYFGYGYYGGPLHWGGYYGPWGGYYGPYW